MWGCTFHNHLHHNTATAADVADDNDDDDDDTDDAATATAPAPQPSTVSSADRCARLRLRTYSPVIARAGDSSNPLHRIKHLAKVTLERRVDHRFLHVDQHSANNAPKNAGD